MSITSRILAFLRLGKEEASNPTLEKPEKPVGKAAPAAANRTSSPPPSALPREQRPQTQPPTPPQQVANDGTANILMGAVLYSAIISSQDSDAPPSPVEHFHEAQTPEPAQDHGSHDTGGGSTDYSPPPATDYGSGGGYGGGGFDSGPTFAPEFR